MASMMDLDHLVNDGVDVDVPCVVNSTANADISLSNDDIGDYMKVLTDFESYDEEKNLEDISSQDGPKPIDKIAQGNAKYEQCLTRQNEIDMKYNDLMKRINMARCQKYAKHVSTELAVFRADISRSIASKPKPPPTMDLVVLQQLAEQAKPANIPDGITLPSVPAPKSPIEPHADFKTENENSMLHIKHLFLSVEEKRKADDVLGQLDAGLRHLIGSYDSDATDSSSGGDSCDEYEDYPSTLGPETRTRSMPIRKRAKWRWLVSRSSVASKWSWLTAQISDLEYRIRQQAEVYRQIRASKGQIVLEDPPKPLQPVNAHPVQGAPISTVLIDSKGRRIVIKEPVSDLPDLDDRGSSRTRPVRPFPRRKFISTQNFHKTSTRAARKSLFKCDCIRPLYWCSVCYGRDDHVQAPDPVSHERGKLVALMDHSYHQVLSSKNDVPLDLQMIHRLKDREWLQKITSEALSRSSAKLLKDKSWAKGKPSIDERRKLKKVDSKKRTVSLRDGEGGSKKKSKLLKDRKQRPLILTNPDGTSGFIDPNADGNSTTPATPITPTLAMIEQLRRRRETAFDINNIVIPYSMASAGRVEKLVYKEIITPTFRLAEEVDEKPTEAALSDCEEDFSDPVFEQRHARAEVEEKNRWLQAFNRPGRSRGRRNDSRAEGNSGCNSPDPLSPIVTQEMIEGNTRPPSPVSVLDEVNAKVRRRRRSSSFTVSQDRHLLDDSHLSRCTSPIVMDHEEVPPYEPRKFPLTDEEYASMIEDMPTGFDSVVAEEEVPEDLPRVERSSPGGMPFSSSSTSPCEEAEDDPDWAADDPDDPEWTRKNENASKEASSVPIKRRMTSGGQK